MVWIPLKNGSGQVVRDIRLLAPVDAEVYTDTGRIVLNKPTEFTVITNNRLGINRYRINLSGGYWTTNTNIRKTKDRAGWEIVGNFHSPEELAHMFGTKVDPDANKPRSERRSFWNSKNASGTINYKQKLRLKEQGTLNKVLLRLNDGSAR